METSRIDQLSDHRKNLIQMVAKGRNRTTINAAGLSDRCEVVSGDFETLIRSDKHLSYPLLSDINMVIRTGGCERTEGECRAPYRAAGLRMTTIIQTLSPTGMTIIEGKPV
jgi:hypothetical protein